MLPSELRVCTPQQSGSFGSWPALRDVAIPDETTVKEDTRGMGKGTECVGAKTGVAHGVRPGGV